MYPEQPPQQMYHPPQPPHQQHHHGSMSMPPPSSSQYHQHAPQAPYEQDPSWRNGGAYLGGNQVEPNSAHSHTHTVKSEADGYSHSQYPSSMQMQGYPQQQVHQQQHHQHQQHMHYQPAPPPYYQPPSVYGNHRPTAGSYPDSSWMPAQPPPPPYMNMNMNLPHYDDKNHPYYAPPPPQYPYGMSSGPYYQHPSSAPMLEPSPVGSGGESFHHHHTMDTTKRQYSPPAAFNEPSKQQKASHSQPHPSSSTSPTTAATSTSSTSLSLITKSARRKKKMYSDFVGVTYNKTHAKYQACITHYRKQHYLGRYKLAVDAALAYDESARLLKGTSWKVNFQTMQDYEKAKAKELESVRRQNGSKVVDVAGSLAAVVMKVEEIASTTGVIRSSSLLPMHSSHNVDSFHSLYEQGQLRPVEEPTCDEGANAMKKEMSTSTIMTTQLPPPNDQSTLLNNTKVTPSPTIPISTPIISTEQQQQQQQGESLFLSPQCSLAETPLPISPNPTRHALGNEKSTPDSVIRPKVLTYRPGGKECGSLPPLSEDGSDTTPSISNSPSKIEGKEASASVKVESASDTKGATTTTGQYSPQKSNAVGTSTTTTAFANSTAKNASVSPHKRAAPPPPVIQNGTLAAASALMTLFGNERSPTQKNN